MENATIIPGLAGAPPAQGMLTQLLDSYAPEEVKQLSMLAEEHYVAAGGDEGAAEGDEGEHAGLGDEGEDADGEVEEVELTAEEKDAAEEAATAAAQQAANTQSTEARSMAEEIHSFQEQAKTLRDDAEDQEGEDDEEGEVVRRTVDLDAFDEKLDMFDALTSEADEAADDCESAADKENFEECGKAYEVVCQKYHAAEELLRQLADAVNGAGEAAVAADPGPDAPESPLQAWIKTYKG